MEWHILLSFEKLVTEPQHGGLGGRKRVKLLCVCICSMYGPNEVKLHTTFQPSVRTMPEASLASLWFFSDYMSYACDSKGTKTRLDNGYTRQGV